MGAYLFTYLRNHCGWQPAYCWLNCRRSVHLPAGQRAGTPSTRHSGPACTRDAQVHRSRSVAFQQPRSEPCRLQNLGLLSGAGVQVSDSWCDRSEAALGWSVVHDETAHYRRGSGRMAKILRCCVSAKGGHFEYKLWHCLTDICNCVYF